MSRDSATAIAYPTDEDVSASFRMLRDELREDLDCDPTGLREIVTAAEAARIVAAAETHPRKDH